MKKKPEPTLSEIIATRRKEQADAKASGERHEEIMEQLRKANDTLTAMHKSLREVLATRPVDKSPESHA